MTDNNVTVKFIGNTAIVPYGAIGVIVDDMSAEVFGCVWVKFAEHITAMIQTEQLVVTQNNQEFAAKMTGATT